MIVNKFIIVLCLVFILLLLNKLIRHQENFQDSTEQVFSTTLNYNCNNYNAEVCGVFENSGLCKIHGDECKPVCRFAPKSEENVQAIHAAGEDGVSRFRKCVEICEENNTGENNTYCNNQQCIDVCNAENYGVSDDIVRYSARDPDVSVEKYYEDVVKRIDSLEPNHPVFNKILNPLKEYTIANLGNDKQNELSSKIDELNNVRNILKDLQEVKLDVDNTGTAKFVDNLERIINRKRSLNSNLDYQVKAKMIQDKISQIKQLTNNYNVAIKKKTGNDVKGAYKSVRCIGNGQTLNIEPVIYNDGVKNFVRKDGDYIIQVNDTILFYEPRNKNTGEICSIEESPLECTLTPTDGTLKRISNNISDDVKHNVSESSELQQAGAYFRIKFINNSDTYNNVIKTAGNFTFDNNDLKYPFFIIQPKNNPGGKCLRLNKKTAGMLHLTVEPCSNSPAERFEAYPYRAFNEKCTSSN